MASKGPEKVIRFTLGVLLGMVGVVHQPSAMAEIRAGRGKGLSTKVNGKKGGSCSEGICKISGGKKAGRNKFLRFKDFDTRGKIKGVEIDTGRKRNLVVGVTSPLGTFINKSIQLSSKANLIWLSPGGIHLGSGAGFVNVPKLNLSTSRSLRFGEGTFDVFKSRASELAAFKGDPLPGSLGFGGIESLDALAADGTVPVIQMDGIDIRMDRELFADAPGGVVEVRESTIHVGDGEVSASRLTLTGEEVVVGDGTELRAEQASGGGTIEVGGSWQNSDETVRQAKRTVVEAGALLDASAGDVGDGGEIVVWSDVTNPHSWTNVTGQLLARGGSISGDGGRIETSGHALNLNGAVPDVGSLYGQGGEWLIDPWNITIGSVDTNTSNSNGIVSASGSPASVSAFLIRSALGLSLIHI